MNPDNAVTVARMTLEHAEADRRAQHRGELVKRLEAVREELGAARNRYRELSNRIKAEREFRNKTQLLINQVVEALGQSARQRPAVADYLPKDPEVVAWSKQHKYFERERDKLIARRDAAPQTPVMDAVIYEGPSGIIAQLERAEQNLLNTLNGNGVGKLPPGGIFSVI